ncbi:MAG: hypothetical protein C0475_04850 [Planctomyces sp.]|nr:hypothetical protein [Planctomyces sp.]
MQPTRPNSARPRNLLWRSLPAATLLALASCQPAQRDADAIARFERGDYLTAYSLTINRTAIGPAQERQRAALIAGQSAHALGRHAEATRLLTPLIASPDLTVAGTARATLGMAAQDQGDHRAATEHFTRAATLLSGDDAQQAKARAQASARKAGLPAPTFAASRPPSGPNTQQQATGGTPSISVNDTPTAGSTQGRATTPTIGSGTPTARPASGALPDGPYTLQFGAFAQRSRAESVARQYASACARAGLPAPAIQAVRDDAGRSLFAVRSGVFRSRAVAESTLRQTGVTGVVLALAGQ